MTSAASVTSKHNAISASSSVAKRVRGWLPRLRFDVRDG